MKKEPYDSSTEKAKTLTVEDFGTLNEVKEMARPVRSAFNRQEAVYILKEIIKDTPVMSSRSGTMARISSRSAGKLVSSDAVKASFDEKAHYLAVVNIDKLFSNAIEPWEFELNPNKNNQGLKARKYLYAPLNYNGKIFPVKFTVKCYQDNNLLNKIYSLEALDVIFE